MQNPIPATIQKVETMSRHARIQIDTQETITPEQLSELFALHEKVGWFFFFDSPDTMQVKTDDLPAITLDDGEKSPSQRLRAVLFVLWEQSGKPQGTFELYYRDWMERVINGIKEKLT